MSLKCCALGNFYMAKSIWNTKFKLHKATVHISEIPSLYCPRGRLDVSSTIEKYNESERRGCKLPKLQYTPKWSNNYKISSFIHVPMLFIFQQHLKINIWYLINQHNNTVQRLFTTQSWLLTSLVWLAWLAWHSMHKSIMWFLQMAQLSTSMSHAQSATAFHFLTCKMNVH